MKQIIVIALLLMCASFGYAQRNNNNGRVANQGKNKTSLPGNSRKTKNSNSSGNISNRSRVLKELESNMIYVEGGTYLMGKNYEGVQNRPSVVDAVPVHEVNVASFYICKFEVTQELWQAVMGQNPSGSWRNTQSQVKGGKKPVVNVSRHDCIEFISKLNMLTGKLYRLPKETEWEYAARGGKKSNGYKYSGSNSLNRVAWYKGNSGSMLHEVGQKEPNELGIFDMSGNAAEWCSDSFYYYYDLNRYYHDFGIVRGGRWNWEEGESEVTYRVGTLSPGNAAHDSIGLRLVMSPEDQ